VCYKIAIDDDKNREFRPFVEANWLHNTRDTRVRMDDISNSLSGTKNAGEVKLGVEGQITPRLAVCSGQFKPDTFFSVSRS